MYKVMYEDVLFFLCFFSLSDSTGYFSHLWFLFVCLEKGTTEALQRDPSSRTDRCCVYKIDQIAKLQKMQDHRIVYCYVWMRDSSCNGLPENPNYGSEDRGCHYVKYTVEPSETNMILGFINKLDLYILVVHSVFFLLVERVCGSH